MEDQPSSSSSSASSSSSSAAASTSRDTSGGAAASVATTSSSNASQVREEEDDDNRYQQHNHFRHPELEQNHEIGTLYGGNLPAFDEVSTVITDDTWSCIIVLLTFWFFVSMTLILGVYGSSSLELGPNTSILLQPNPFFVQSIKVQLQELNISNPGTILYGFYSTPPLDTATIWSETRTVSVPADSHTDWIYYLNAGSQISISYSVNSPSSSVFLIIAQGKEGLARWLEEPTYPNTTLSWNLIHGSGMIEQDLSKSSTYYVSVGNLNADVVEVQLNFTMNALVYNTSTAYSKCTFMDESCTLKILFPEGNVAVLTTPGTEQDTPMANQYVKLSYGPRWATYIVGIGGMTVLMLLAFNFLNKYRCTNGDGIRVQHDEFRSERAPLLSYKDDDQSSWGSSYDSASNDEGDLEDFLAGEGKSSRDGESNNTRRLCAICFDAPRDCFFLPCGHCVACFECATRIAEAAATCPVCRRNIKKVRKIFTV